ncbi:MAG: peptidylprolyl isomerase [Lachnospiraceae bacterium]|nr:peptidylprolyl isomerase [Candidatus Merdinaster equi]
MKKIVRSIVVGILSVMTAAVLVGCSADNAKSDSNENSNESSNVNNSSEVKLSGLSVKEFSQDELLTGKHYVEIEVKDYGTMTVELDADIAPITVTNFVQLASQGFYDGLTFHRVKDGFMIQGGDPLGIGLGNPGYTIKGEFADNGIENSISLTPGAIAMGRTSNNMDSAGCQFFICQIDCSPLDGQYAGFGYVIDGFEIVDAIAKNTPVIDGNGTVAKENQPVINSIKVVQK